MNISTISRLVIFVFSIASGRGAVHYVDWESANPKAPYTNWSTAACVIQDAVDAAVDGELVIVTNGVYRLGGRPFSNLTNRVTLLRRLTLQSVNGPDSTVIEGHTEPPQTRFGLNSVRCIYLTNGAAVNGFTITNGSTLGYGFDQSERGGAGIYCPTGGGGISNCVITANHAYTEGGGAYGCILVNCMIFNNEAVGQYGMGGDGGGVANSTLTCCTVAGNSGGGRGGGTSDSTLYDCVISNNFAAKVGGGISGHFASNCLVVANSSVDFGGGAHAGTLVDCALLANKSSAGGGAYSTDLYRCMIISNSASGSGGGISNGDLENCVLLGNSAGSWGGGADRGLLVNCTVVGNLANIGGGTFDCRLTNSIVYYNAATNNGGNSSGGLSSYCCITGVSAEGNFTDPPRFFDAAAGNFRLQSNSPCINAGNNAAITAQVDLDQNSRIRGATVDVGAYEFPSPGSLISYAWLSGYGLPHDGSQDFADSDGDGMNNWQEWRCGTDPTNNASVLRIVSQKKTGSSLALTWQSVAGKRYCVERTSDVALPTSFRSLATNILSRTNTLGYIDTNVPATGAFFYRVGVR